MSGRITSYFGYRTSPTAGASSNHKGIDISVPVGSTVVAAKAGTVVTAAYSASAGNYIAISHGDGVYTYYMHCSSLAVSSGAKVSQGQKSHCQEIQVYLPGRIFTLRFMQVELM